MADILLEQAWITFHEPLLLFVRRRVADEASAEDIVQDVFLKAHIHKDTLSDITKLQAWLYQLTRNAIIDYYRRARLMLAIPEETPALVHEVENNVTARLTPAFKHMIASLPDIYREALYLTEYQGLTQKEMAERLDISVSGAKSRVQRARQLLRHMLLDCCHFDLDRRNGIIRYHEHCGCSAGRFSSCGCQ